MHLISVSLTSSDLPLATENHCLASLEDMVRTGHNGYNSTPNNNTAKLRTVKAMERNIEQGRHEVDSIYTS